MVDKSTQTKTRRVELPPNITTINESLNESILSIGSNNDSRDPDWQPEEESDISDDDMEIDNDVNEAKENKYIVFESCLDELLKQCLLCGSNSVTEKKDSRNMSCVCIKMCNMWQC